MNKKFDFKKLLTMDFILLGICLVIFAIHPYVGSLALWVYWFYLIVAYRDFLCGFMGQLGISNNHPNKAISWYKTAAKTTSAKVKYIRNYVYCEIKYGSVEDADRVLNKILEKRKTHKPFKGQELIDLQMVRALLEWKKGDVDKAIEILEEVFKEDKSTTVYTTIAYMKTIKGDIDKSLEFSKEAYEKFEDDILVKSIYAINLYKNDQKEEAEVIFKELCNGVYNIPDNMYFYALILMEKGNKEEAIKMLNKGLRLLKETIITIVEPKDYTSLLESLEEDDDKVLEVV